MSSDDFSPLPQRIPDREYSAFKSWLLEKASNEQSEYLFTSRYTNLGLSLTYLFEVYEAGRNSKIPESWIPLYKEMKQEQSSEYQTYLKLKEKYENQHNVSEITIEKSFNFTVQEAIVEDQSIHKKKRKQPNHGRQIKKNGGVSSFY